jgi:hypothetical protein
VNRARLAAVLTAPPIPPIGTREEIIDVLSAAAELEHAIMCQYLFAALSIDRASPELSPAASELARTFTLELLAIARQEMEHLGIVTNLLIAVGAPPDFDRPNLPLQANYYALDLPLQLLPFGDAFLALAVRLEESISDSRAQRALPYYPTIAAIYDRLSDGLQHLGGPGGSLETTLFLGANDPQISNADFGATPTQVWYSLTLLPVTDLKSALAAVELIRVQGEGSSSADVDSHYAIVRRIKQQWDLLAAAERAAMCKPVPPNPVTRQRGDVDPLVTCCLLRDPRAVKLARIANRAYELILLLLARLYGTSDATAADRDVYRKYAFFPLMTIVIRPLGEILTELPAGDGEHCATATFELDAPIRTYPDRTSFNIQLGERLAHIAAELAEVAAMPDVPSRLQFVAKNAAYVRDRVLAYVTTGKTETQT